MLGGFPESGREGVAHPVHLVVLSARHPCRDGREHHFFGRVVSQRGQEGGPSVSKVVRVYRVAKVSVAPRAVIAQRVCHCRVVLLQAHREPPARWRSTQRRW